MHCSRCNAKNLGGANFCYKCGKKLSERKICRINKNPLYDNIHEEKIISLKNFIHKNMIISENRYRNIFILSAIIVFCSVLSVPLCKGIPESFNLAMSFVNTSAGQLSKEVLKSQAELFFRDVFVRIMLILISWGILIFDVLILGYIYVIRKKYIKNKKL